MRVSVETIYQVLYFQARGGLKQEVQAAIRSGGPAANHAGTPSGVLPGSSTQW
jgi:IS30 family transposase